MAEYKLSSIEGVVERVADGACIPDDPDNRDREEYEAWVAAGGRPDPYEGPSLRMPVADARKK